MTWLAPLGFLGLIGIVALIIIYIIKPNYQKKMVSSTFVWQLSLKYRKKRLPVSRLNNILIFICQVLILTICGLLLARPVIEQEKAGDENEKIIIIDASASMRVTDGSDTRFARAVNQARTLAEDTATNGGVVSIILADTTPEYIVQRSGEDKLDDILAAVDGLLENPDSCSYSSADMNSAVSLTEEVLRYNHEAQVFFYTATEYLEKNGINVIDVSKDDVEWNAAILSADAKMNDNNHYEITIDVGCYNRTDKLTVYCEIHGANGKESKILLQRDEYFDPADEEKVVVFNTDDLDGQPLYSFDYLEVYVSVDDSFVDDNSFFLYGGTKPSIKIQYSSSIPNNYFGGVVRTIREVMKDQWTIEFKELKSGEKAATEGFDLYIFEHTVPSVMPTDGIVLLVDPYGSPEGAGITFGNTTSVSSDSTLATGITHELTKYVDFSRITVAQYTEILSSDGYEELAYYKSQPVILAKNEDNAKIVVWAFDLNKSSLPLNPDFSFLVYNMFNYFIPSTIDSNTFEIGDTVDLAARGTDLKVEGNGFEYTMVDKKTDSITVTRPGTYTVTQTPMSGDELIIENFYVRIPTAESQITRQVEAIPVADVDSEVRVEFEDLMFYFAIALVSFMSIEWILQIKKNF